MNYFEKQTILVPVDFSELSENAVETAIKIAGNCENVTVLHVIDSVPHRDYSNMGFELGGGFDSDAFGSDERSDIRPSGPGSDFEQEERAVDMLQRQFSDSRHKGLHFAANIDDAPHGIADFAQEHKFDLIVMPSHGRTGLKRLLIGSVAERVVRLAHCPVLVLRS